MLPTLTLLSSTKPKRTDYGQTRCFPTSSCISPPRAGHLGGEFALHTANASLYRFCSDTPLTTTTTLSVPLAISYKTYSCYSRSYGKSDQVSSPSKQSYSSSTQQKQSGQEHASSCSSSSLPQLPARGGAKKHPGPYHTRLGFAFARCLDELRHFVRWDKDNLCLSVDESCQAFVDDRLYDFGFYGDSDGNYQNSMVPKYSTFVTCEHGCRTPKASTATTATNHNHKTSGAAKHFNPLPSTSKGAPTTNNASSAAPACKFSCSPAWKPNNPTAANPTSKPLANSANKTTPPSAGTATTTATRNNNATAAAAAGSATISPRRKSKMPEQNHPPSLLSDCRRFTNFAESNAEERIHMSLDTSLVEVMRQFNRAVLGLRPVLSESLVWCELGGLAALLNYAVTYYLDVADKVERLMQKKLGQEVVQEFYMMMYGARAKDIEMEEFRSGGGCAEGGSGSEEERRERRRIRILNSFHKFLPEVMDLRDFIQVVIFRLMWINETAFQSFEVATKDTLHDVIPLLQTVIVRCVRQAHFTLRAITSLTNAETLTSSPHQLNTSTIQSDLLKYSEALQNLSGGNLVLFTSDRYSPNGDKSRRKKGKGKRGWNESVVSCPGVAHLYMLLIVYLTFEMLQALPKAIESGLLQPSNHSPPKETHAYCNCHEAEEVEKRIMEVSHKRLTLIERKQFNWKPHLCAPKKSKKKSKKGRSHGSAQHASAAVGIKEDDGGKGDRLELADVLRKRIAEIERRTVVPTSRDCPPQNGNQAPASASTGRPCPTTTSPNLVDTATKPTTRPPPLVTAPTTTIPTTPSTGSAEPSTPPTPTKCHETTIDSYQKHFDDRYPALAPQRDFTDTTSLPNKTYAQAREALFQLASPHGGTDEEKKWMRDLLKVHQLEKKRTEQKKQEGCGNEAERWGMELGRGVEVVSSWKGC